MEITMQTTRPRVNKFGPALRADRGRPGSLLTRYVRAAMQQTTYEESLDGTFHGAIPNLSGIVAEGDSQSTCQVALRERLELWLVLQQCQHLPIPALHGIPLSGWIGMKRGF